MPKIFLKTLGILISIVFIFNSCFKDDLLKEIDALKTQVSAMQKRNDSLNNVLNVRADSLAKALTSAQKRSDSLSNVLRTKSDSLSLALGVTNASLANLTKSVDSIKTQIGTISGQLTQLNVQLTTITTQLTQLNQQLGALGGDVSQLAAQYQALSASLQTINTQIAALHTEQLKLLERLNAILLKLNPAVDITTGLVAYYPFSGNAGDSSGNGNHGSVTGATLSADRFDAPNRSYFFNGISNFISVPFSNSFNSIQNGLTMSAWVYMQGGTGSGTPPRILELRGAYGGGGNAGFVMLAQSNSNISRTFEVRWHNNFGNTNISISPTSNVSALTWHLITFTCDGLTATGKFYVDGNLINTNVNMPFQGIINSCNYNNNPLYIGAEPNLLGKWGGKIDDVRIYNRALTQEQITYLANN